MAFPILGTPKPQFLDSSGAPLASGTLSVLEPADDTNKASYPTYDDAEAATNANSNPLTLDARGEPATGLWGLDGQDYKLVLKDSSGATIWTSDDVFLPINVWYSAQTSAESAASVTPSDYTYPPGNVLRYGSDGVAIQAAINQATQTGGADVYIPAGTYETVNDIDLKSNVVIRGAGIEKTIVKCSDSFTVSDIAIFTGSNISGVKMSDLTLDGNATNLAQTSGHACMRLSAISDCVFERIKTTDCGKTAADPAGAHITVRVRESGDTGIEAWETASVHAERNVFRDMVFDDPNMICQFGLRLFTNFTYAIAPGSFTIYNRYNRIENCHFEGFAFNAVELAGVTCTNNTVANCVNTNMGGYVAFEADKGASFNTFYGNKVDGIQKSTLVTTAVQTPFRVQGYLDASNGDRIAEGNIFSHNVIADVSGTCQTNSVGIMVSYADDTLVCNNNFDLTNGSFDIHGAQILTKVNNVKITDNHFRGCYYGVYNDSDDIDANVSDWVISGNYIDASQSGIILSNTEDSFNVTNVQISDNYIVGGLAAQGISVDGDTVGTKISDVMISGNFIKGVTANGLNIRCTDIAMLNNHIVDAGAIGIKMFTGTANAYLSGNVVVGSSATQSLDDDVGDAIFVGNYFENNNTSDIRGRLQKYAGAAPGSGTYAKGDIVWNQDPDAAEYIGWVCTTAGTPGTWKGFGTIES